MELPISHDTWAHLVLNNRQAVANGWAQRGVFGTGIGPEYQVGKGLLYVGKSAGPLGELVGFGTDQNLSREASVQWMISRRNKSAFWQFVDRIDPTRRSIAWTNVCKMDSIGGQKPPNAREWSQVCNASTQALKEEMEFLKPKVAVFATSGLYGLDVNKMLHVLGFRPVSLPFKDGWTALLEAPSGLSVFLTKHPQGWPNSERDRVISAVKERLKV